MNRYTGVFAFVVLLAVTVSPSIAQHTFTESFTTTTYKDTLNTTAHWDTTSGDLKLFPFVPTLAGTYDTPWYVRDVCVEGDLAFVADYYGGLKIIDISIPGMPTLVGTCNTPGYALGVAVAGDLAFVADNTSTYNTPGDLLDVAVAGDLAFAADDTSGLQIIDISDPTTPALVGTYDTPASGSRRAPISIA